MNRVPLIKRCTALNCLAAATHPQLGKDSTLWAHLCEPCHNALDADIKSGSTVRMIAGWIRSQGGVAGTMQRMQPAVKAAQRLGYLLGETRG